MGKQTVQSAKGGKQQLPKQGYSNGIFPSAKETLGTIGSLTGSHIGNRFLGTPGSYIGKNVGKNIGERAGQMIDDNMETKNSGILKVEQKIPFFSGEERMIRVTHVTHKFFSKTYFWRNPSIP